MQTDINVDISNTAKEIVNVVAFMTGCIFLANGFRYQNWTHLCPYYYYHAYYDNVELDGWRKNTSTCILLL